ncbi:type IX secretion system protein PorD [Aegicerativicinus sediminis]
MLNKLVLFFIAIGFSTFCYGQELNCKLVVNAMQTGNEQNQIFKTLERQLNEFINNTQWTNKNAKPQERIDCSMVVTIQDYSSDIFRATLQIQSSRPVFNSTYTTPIYNFNDRDFTFQYLEFQNLVYNPSQYESNLISVLTFHINMILGIDADTFEPMGGETYFKQAQTILNYTQQNNYKGWKAEDGQQTRFMLIDQMLSNQYKEFRDAMYKYHRLGLDEMSTDAKEGKQSIADAIADLRTMNNRRPNSFLLRVFFDAKASEIEEIFSDGPSITITTVMDNLNRIAPTHASKWRNISY